MDEQQRFSGTTRQIQNLLLLVSLIFIGWFVVDQWQGIRTMLDFVYHAITSVPDFIGSIIDYFKKVPSQQLRDSMLIGGVFGAISTALVYLSANNGERLKNFNPLRTGMAVAIGTVAGAAGSQILMYPTQHCTYAPDIEAAQYRAGLLVTIFSTLILLIPTWTLLNYRQTIRTGQSQSGYFRNKLLPYLFLLPSLFLLFLFLYYPAEQILMLSLKAKLRSLPQERFVCMQNFVNLTNDGIQADKYQNSFTVTLFITIFIVLLSLSIALAVATLASQKIRGASIYRTLLIWPYAISPVVTGVIFLSMFREGGVGLLNWALDSVFGFQVDWITDENIAPWVIILTSVWNILGFNILFYIAGLQNIPGDLLEAAALDGANAVQRFFRITFPLLSPFTFFLLVTNITFSFYGIYGVVDVLTQGGPVLGAGGNEGGATDVLIYKLYTDAFGTGSQVGFAAAQAVVLFLMVAGLTILQFRYVDRRVTYGG